MSGSVIIDAKVKMKRERDKTMKILGLSFGKKNANCDILTKEALYGAREAYPDAEIKFINSLQTFLDDIQVQKSQKAAAEAKAQGQRGLRLKEQGGVV